MFIIMQNLHAATDKINSFKTTASRITLLYMRPCLEATSTVIFAQKKKQPCELNVLIQTNPHFCVKLHSSATRRHWITAVKMVQSNETMSVRNKSAECYLPANESL
jgi:hypothetical protein